MLGKFKNRINKNPLSLTLVFICLHTLLRSRGERQTSIELEKV